MGRSTHWLNRERIKIYPRIVLGLIVVVFIAWVLLSKDRLDPQGKPLGADFIAFWAASHIALAGHAEDAYNLPSLFKAVQVAVPASQSIFAWYYPPSFYLVVLPLALLPYLAAYLTFILSTLICYLVVLRRIAFNTTARWCLAAFPGLWMNVFHGQNAFLTAALAGAAMLCLRRRPIVAGVFIGLLTLKPQLAVLFPVALLAIGAWRTLISAALTALCFFGLGTAVLGTATISGCISSLGDARHFLESGVLPWAKMPSVFAFLRLLGTPVIGAYAVHGLVAARAVFAVWYVWRRCADCELRGAALFAATFLCSPYIYDYDLAWLAFPIGWLALAGLRTSWLRGEREVLVAAWLLPLAMDPVATGLHVQIAPFVLIALLVIAVRRAAGSSRTATMVVHRQNSGFISAQ
ncbi:glycosyltransferase family 87 protein [Paraburkholderia sp. A2RI-6]|uniref:glycosyltransferase family 87 protein n=1 Tax=Paraburkholderia sp. A2RI-6 TaxID=3028371 RepID=UPI003B7E20DB